MKAQEDSRERVEHRETVGGLEVLRPRLLAGQVPGESPDDRRGLVVRGGRLDALAVPLVNPTEEVRGAPVDLRKSASPQDHDGPLEGRLRPRDVARFPEHEPEVVEEQADPWVGRPKPRLGDLERALEVAPGEDVVPESLGDARPVPERLGQRGVIRPQGLLLDPECPLDQRQGRRIVAADPKDVREVGQDPRNGRTIGAEGLLPNRQSALDERSGLGVIIQPLVQRAVLGQDVGELGVLGTQHPLLDAERALEGRPRLVVLAEVPVEPAKVGQRLARAIVIRSQDALPDPERSLQAHARPP